MNILHKSHTQLRSVLKGTLAWGMARSGKAPTTALLSNRRPMNRRHRRKSPMPDYPTPDYPTPATPTIISLEFRRGVPYNYPRRAVSLISMRGVSSSHRTRLNIGWPVQTGRTIHFINESHKYPSPDIITNPSTGRIHHYVYNILHICGNIKKQSRSFLITHFINSTALIERPRQTDSLPTCHRLARHHRGANLQRHTVAPTTHIRPLRTTTTICTPASL